VLLFGVGGLAVGVGGFIESSVFDASKLTEDEVIIIQPNRLDICKLLPRLQWIFIWLPIQNGHLPISDLAFNRK
jgi:hypothetical protein